MFLIAGSPCAIGLAIGRRFSDDGATLLDHRFEAFRPGSFNISATALNESTFCQSMPSAAEGKELESKV
jgi:hypothetical protein